MNQTLTGLFALTFVAISACGGSSPTASSGTAPEPAAVEAPVPAEPVAGDTAAAEPAGAADASEPMDENESAESCYVIRAGEQEGCWDTTEEACSASGCGEECTCTEASSRNTCSC